MEIAVVGGRLPVTAGTAVIGLLLGSFLNVVVYRVPRGLSVVRPGSFCPACGTPIRGVDNVPVVSWVVLRGRCRRCGEPISARYPLVELLTGVVFGILAWALGPHWAVPGMCALAATLLALAAIEADGIPGPAAVSLIGTGLGVALLAAAATADGRWWHLGGALIGTALAGTVLAFTRRAGRGAAGAGRVVAWALLPAGAAWGWVGLRGIVVGVPVAACVLVVLATVTRARIRRGGHRRAGVAVAVALGVTAALAAALAAGSPIGR